MIKKKLFIALIVSMQPFISLSQEAKVDPNWGIIPVPVSIKTTGGTFNIDASIQVQAVGVDDPNLIKFAKDIIEQNTDGRNVDYRKTNVYYKLVIDKSLALPD